MATARHRASVVSLRPDHRLWRTVAALLLLIWALSGRMESPVGGWEVRNAAAVLATLLTAMVLAFSKQPPVVRRSSWIVLASVTLLHFVVLINAAVLGASDSTPQVAFDVFHSIAPLAMLLLVIRDFRDFVNVLIALEVFGAILLGLGALELRSLTDAGPGWSAFGTTFTFYRIEALAAGAAGALAMLAPQGKSRWIHLTLATLFLYAGLRSSSLGAFIGSAIAGILMMVVLVGRGSYRQAAAVTGVFAIAFGALFYTQSLMISARVSNARPQDVSAVVSQDPRRTSPDQEEEQDLVKVITKNGPVPLVDYLVEQKLVVVSDRTQRIGMALAAVSDFSMEPLWGIGWNRFSYVAILDIDRHMGTYSYPHNVVLEFASQAGLVGLLALLIANIAAVAVAGQRIANHQWLLGLGAAAAALFTGSLLGGNWYDLRLYWLALILISMVPRASAASTTKR